MPLALVFALQAAQPLDLSDGPRTLTSVAVTVALDSEGRVVSCKPGIAGAVACASFKKGRVVSAPLRKNGRPTGGLMTVSTTSIVSAR